MNQEQALELIRKRKGKTFLSEGSSRKVYEINGYIIKKAKNKRGRIECANEFWLSRHIDEAYRHLLCPILYFKEGVIIMEKAELVDKEYFEKHIQNQYDSLIQLLFKQYGVDDFDLGFHFNWGIHNGQPIIIDYGHNYFEEEAE